MIIPFSPPDISEAEIKEVIDTLRSGWITTGPKTKLLERRIAEYVGTQRAVCLNSATAAMELTLRLLGIGPGDEVITSAYTYSASASVIHHVGAKIVLLDTVKDSYEMDYNQLHEAITERTKAVIPVDIAGVLCDYDRILKIVESKQVLFSPSNSLQEAIGRVVVLADAAHSFGAKYKGKNSGQVADFTSFSFHAVKNLTTAEGGAVTWREIPGISNDDLYKEFMLLALHGQSKDALAKTKPGAWEYDIVYPGYKCNMTDIMAALGLAQLDRYQTLLERRRELIELYDSCLAAMDSVDILRHYGQGFASSGHLYMVQLKGKGEVFRNRVIELMAERGVATNVHYKPLPMHTAYKTLGFDIKHYPNSLAMYANEITLPLHSLLTPAEVEYVCEQLQSACSEASVQDTFDQRARVSHV